MRERDLEINCLNRRCLGLALHDGVDALDRDAAFFVATMARSIERRLPTPWA